MYIVDCFDEPRDPSWGGCVGSVTVNKLSEIFDAVEKAVAERKLLAEPTKLRVIPVNHRMGKRVGPRYNKNERGQWVKLPNMCKSCTYGYSWCLSEENKGQRCV